MLARVRFYTDNDESVMNTSSRGNEAW
uniref:Uncharacterized protein n=1 Tax=Anguilla anguilla TaxID=7936 RepID=A0A0E9R5N1_ANGAN